MPRIRPFARLFVVASVTAAVTSLTIAPSNAAPSQSDSGKHAEPLIVGHRGASGYRPEHTLASYELAARMGADYVEPDLVSTKDGVLVARHENEISGTTDVSERPEFAERKTTKKIDGVDVTGWFTEDFTLEELKTLRAKERIPDIRPRNTIYDGRYEIPTFQEIIDLKRRLSKELGREIGIYPETKHPTYFSSIDLPLEPALIKALKRNKLDTPKSKVYVQSFEVSNLKRLDKQLRVPVVQLVSNTGAPYDFVEAGDPRTYADLVTPKGLREIATYADGVGPEKTLVVKWNDDGTLGKPTALVRNAHKNRLQVHPWTFRAENTFLPADYRSSDDPAAYGRVIDEIQVYLDAGVDGFFTDNPDIGVVARDER